jgi:hypothetical protein
LLSRFDFFRDNPSASRARQIVGTLASPRALFFICSRSSSRVASGDSATSSVKIIKWSSFKTASAPPPWGNVTQLALLAQQFVNKGFVNAKHPSDLAFGGDASFYGINNSFSKV